MNDEERAAEYRWLRRLVLSVLVVLFLTQMVAYFLIK